MVWEWIPKEEARMMEDVWAMEDSRVSKKPINLTVPPKPKDEPSITIPTGEKTPTASARPPKKETVLYEILAQTKIDVRGEAFNQTVWEGDSVALGKETNDLRLWVKLKRASGKWKSVGAFSTLGRKLHFLQHPLRSLKSLPWPP